MKFYVPYVCISGQPYYLSEKGEWEWYPGIESLIVYSRDWKGLNSVSAARYHAAKLAREDGEVNVVGTITIDSVKWMKWLRVNYPQSHRKNLKRA